ncbi:hypothetical protein TNCV_4876651 [Trichonephila clavipes]|nr:hypothetical protein TNCV_4876651 [Trichonephila clavipes]
MSAREVPAFRFFFPEKDEEDISSVSTCNVKQTKEVLLEVAIDLGVEVNSTLTKSQIKNRICQSKYYVEESVKCLLEGILEEKREEREEREKQEIREYEERRLAGERELERMRVQLRNKLIKNKLKAGYRINDLANVSILSDKRTAEVVRADWCIANGRHRHSDTNLEKPYKENRLCVKTVEYGWVGSRIEQRRKGTGGKREGEKEGKRARKRQGLVVLGSGEENPRVLRGDADQESETRMSKNALRTGRRQAVE